MSRKMTLKNGYLDKDLDAISVHNGRMICSKAHKCQRIWSCLHKQDHNHTRAFDYTIPDTRSVCLGARCHVK
jgi:hypothetical protein